MIHLSFSQYNIWKTCPFQWKLLYIDKIKIPSASIDLVFGSSLVNDYFQLLLAFQ